jgi:hypothetical protein
MAGCLRALALIAVLLVLLTWLSSCLDGGSHVDPDNPYDFEAHLLECPGCPALAHDRFGAQKGL